MGTTPDYIKYVMKTIKCFPSLHYTKMIDDYLLYIGSKRVAIVCNNTVYVKKYPEICELMKTSPCQKPYPNCDDHYILDITNQALTEDVFLLITMRFNIPKPRRPRYQTPSASDSSS